MKVLILDVSRANRIVLQISHRAANIAKRAEGSEKSVKFWFLELCVRAFFVTVIAIFTSVFSTQTRP